jgi:CubicO group peptidase (beta-lactamase class C family)
VALSFPRLDRLDALAREGITEAGVAPAAVLAVAARQGGGWSLGFGAAGVRSISHMDPIDETTPFDLASVTKPVVACGVARLVRQGLLRWDSSIGSVMPELGDSPCGDVSLELLLAHRAGLAAHGPLYAPLLQGRPIDVAGAIREAAESRRSECVGLPPPGGFPPIYSDLGYVLAGAMASRVAGVDLATLIEREVAAPLGLDVASAETWSRRTKDFSARVAPTEVVEFRGGEIIGVVHDENAWALSGRGLSGHAGLFGTAEAVARFGAAVLDALAGRLPSWLHGPEAEPLVQQRPGGTLRAGFDGRSEEGSSAGHAFGPRAFGHLGFTGTSFWCDPDADVVSVILTNRVSPSRDNVLIRQARPLLNDALFEAARSLGGA